MIPAKTIRVLLLEDHEDTVEMVSLILETNGFEVTALRTLQAALELSAERTFDLYLLDSWLPDGSGLDFCKKIRQADSHTPIVFYSAAAYDGDKDEALANGAQAYLTKPIDSLTLSEQLSRVIELSGDGSSGEG